MQKRILGAIAAFLSGALLFSMPVLAQGDNAAESEDFAVNAKAALVMDALTGRVLYAQNPNQRLPIASTTKIMTALLALEQPDIDVFFEVDPTAILVEGSSMGLQKGDMVSLHALAVGMLLPSGNDAANAAAVRIAGSVAAFVDHMNRRAAEMGLADTNFNTPSGLDGETHYSTAYDMAVLTRNALQNEKFAEICSQYRMRTQFGSPPFDRWLTNHNRLLNMHEDVVGVKTGFTKKAGRCLVSAAKRDGLELIVVTLNSPDDWDVHIGLINRFFAETEREDLTKNMPPVSLYVAGGKTPWAHAQPLAPVPAAVQAGGESKVTYSVTTTQPFLYAPVQKGQLLGTLRIELDGSEVAQVPLVAQEAIEELVPYVEKRSLWQRLTGLFQKQA